ncbi:hypothetical protein BS78_02G372500 [Paspalum vaginatum]|nr:hypothetical protein BS78_02G372500 [Paspalum vaginatum]
MRLRRRRAFPWNAIYAFSPPSCNELHSFRAMSCAANGSHHHRPDEEGPGWSWRSLPSPQPPFDFYEVVTSYAVHSDGRTIFMATSYRDRPGLQKSTYSFNAKYSVWRWHSWVLPFSGQGFFDGELDAWVGLDRDGHSCEVPSDVGSETPVGLGAAQLDWQVAEENLFGDQEAEMHLRASLAYIGRSKFCLVRSVRHDGGACVLHLTMFGLKYNNKGGLCITNHRSSRSYRVPKHRDSFYPEAFWL